jgi:hypothetical protein
MAEYIHEVGRRAFAKMGKVGRKSKVLRRVAKAGATARAGRTGW